jgi:hypothetical protein
MALLALEFLTVNGFLTIDESYPAELYHGQKSWIGKDGPALLLVCFTFGSLLGKCCLPFLKIQSL